MSTKKQLKEMSKPALIATVLAAEQSTAEVRKLRHKEVDDHLRTIANLQARCMTLRHQRQRGEGKIAALNNLVNGLNALASKAELFDIRNTDVLNRISALFGPGECELPSGRQYAAPLVPLHICPMCGEITKAEGGYSGERICAKCMTKVDWPWPGEIVWHVNEDGHMEGVARGGYEHQSGDTILTTEHCQYHQAK